MPRKRLDLLLVERGLAESRQRAQALIKGDLVKVDGLLVGKSGYKASTTSDIEVLGEAHPYVGRGGVKLEGALAHFRVDPKGWVALDIGASTGGFTDVLLRNGAKRVYAIDVGKNQLKASLQLDPRVISMEGVNARYLDELSLPEKADGAVMDVSFISITKILPALKAHLKAGATLVTLVKPQFELGPQAIGKGGIVRQESQRLAALERVKGAMPDLGFEILGESQSSLPGSHGNIEFFLFLKVIST